MKRIRQATAITIGSLALAGCYELVPATEQSAMPGVKLTATISPGGMEAMTAQIGPGVRVIEGRLTAVSDVSVTVDVMTIRVVSGGELPLAGVVVTIPRQHIERLETERVSVRRSALLAGGVLAAIVVSSRVFDLTNRGGSETASGGRGGTRN